MITKMILFNYLLWAHDVRDFIDVVVKAEDWACEKKRLSDVDKKTIGHVLNAENLIARCDRGLDICSMITMR